MTPEDTVLLPDISKIREAVHQYIADNAIWRAEDRDMVWSDRYLTAKMGLLAGKQMTFGELVSQVQIALLETTHPRVRELTAELMANAIIR